MIRGLPPPEIPVAEQLRRERNGSRRGLKPKLKKKPGPKGQFLKSLFSPFGKGAGWCGKNRRDILEVLGGIGFSVGIGLLATLQHLGLAVGLMVFSAFVIFEANFAGRPPSEEEEE